MKLFGKFALCPRIPGNPRSSRHCSYQTAKKSAKNLLFPLSRCSTIVYCNSLVTYRYVYIYMFTLDTDSLKTLGFNPRTPTLWLRPMTSWPFKYLPRRSLCLPPALLSSSFSSRSCFLARFARDREPRWNFSVNYAGGNAGPVSRGPVVHVHRIQHCSPTRVLVYKHGRRETQFRAGGIRFFK